MGFENIDFSEFRYKGMKSYKRVCNNYQKKPENYHEIDDVYAEYCTLLLSKEETINQEFRQLGIKGPAIKSMIKEILCEDQDFIKKVFTIIFTQLEDRYHSLFEKQQNNLYALNKTIREENNQIYDLQVKNEF